MNKLLLRQLHKYLDEKDQLPENLTRLLHVISESYDHYERDRNMMERSIEISSKEMIELNTELKKEKEELKKTHKELNTLFENVDEVFYSADMVTDKLIQVSAASEKIYGYTPAEFLADAGLCQNLVYPEDNHYTEEEQKTLKQGKQVYNQYRIIHKDKSIRWVENKITPTLDETGRLIRIDGVTSDITERKNAEAAIIKKDGQFAIASKIAKLGYWELDVLNGMFTFNDDFYSIFKTSTKEVGGNTMTVERYAQLFVYPDDREIVGIEVAKAINSADPHFSRQLEHRIVYADGTMGYMSVFFYIVKNDEGQTVKTFGINQDITDRRNAEEKIKESELRYRSLIEQATDTICIADANMKFVEMNPSGCRMFGYSRDEILQLSLIDIVFKEDLKTNPFKIEELRTGKTVRNERRIKRKDGTAMEVELSGKILEDGRMMIFGRDITERKLAESALRKRENQFAIAAQIAKLAYWELDVAKGLFTFNDQFYAVFKTTAPEAGGYTMTIERYAALFIYPEDRTYVVKEMEKATQSTDPLFNHKLEHRIVYSGGGIGYISVSCYIVNDEAGQTIRSFGINQDITDRKKAEEKIKESELRYRSLIEQATDTICIADASMKVIDINPSGCLAFGYSKEEVLQLSFSDLLFKEDLKTNPFRIDDLKSGKSIRNERRIKRKDGTAVEVELSGKMLEDGRIMVIGRDITERKQADLQLKESNERYNLISKATNDMVWDWDLVTDKVYRSKEGWKKIFRSGDKEFENETTAVWDNRIHPEDKKRVITIKKELLTSTVKDFFEIECRMLRDDGNYAYIHDRGNIIRNKKGKPVRLIGATQDITQRKEAELQVAKSEHKFRSLVQNGSDIICIFNERGYFIYSNPAIKRMLGYEPEDTIEKNAFSFIHPEDERILKDCLAEMKPGKYLEMPPFRFKNIQGEWRWLETKITDMSNNPEVMGYVFNSRDITDNVLLERELDKERLAKQKEITDAVISAQEQERQELGSELHDNINQILAGSRLYLGLAKKELKTDHHFLKEADTLLLSAITEIRNLSHSLIPPSLDESELIGAIENIIEVTHQTSGININLHACGFDETNIPDKLKLSIYRIVQEQFNNILKHANAQKIIVRLIQEKEKIMLSIKDDGVGFDTSKKPNGVGLMNIRTRASLFNGQLTIISSPGNGCELRVLFN